MGQLEVYFEITTTINIGISSTGNTMTAVMQSHEIYKETYVVLCVEENSL